MQRRAATVARRGNGRRRRGRGWWGLGAFRRALKSRVDTRSLSVYDLDPRQLGTFDLVFFLSVLHHLDHPLLALE